MRLVLVMLAVLGAAHATPNAEVEKLFKEVVSMIPKDDVIALFMAYAENDADVKEMVQEIQGDPSPETLVERAEIIAPFKDFISYCNVVGLDIVPYITRILEFIHEMDNYVPNPSQVKPQKIGAGLPGFIEDLKTVLPIDKIAQLIVEREKTSRNVAVFSKALGSSFMKELQKDLREEREKLKNISREYKKGAAHVEL